MPGKTYVTIFSFFLLINSQSCCFSTKNTSLGNGFKLSEFSSKEVEIMFCSDNCCNSGITVIPQTIVAYNFDSNWIIAKSDSTYDNDKSDFAYWLFRKITPTTEKDMHTEIKANLLGPIDSISFYKVLVEKQIHLKLINYPE